MQRLIIEENDGIVSVDAGDVEDVGAYIELLAEAVEKLERISFLYRKDEKMRKVKHFFVDNSGYRGVIYSTPKNNELGEGQYIDIFGGLDEFFSFTEEYLTEIELFSTTYAMDQRYRGLLDERGAIPAIKIKGKSDDRNI